MVLTLILLFTFARSETPCPKTLDGFDKDQHLQVRDVRIDAVPQFRVRVRLKRIKQDQRMERPEARGDAGDEVYVGDVPEDSAFSIRLWLQRLFQLQGRVRPADAPFFAHVSEAGSNGGMPLTYGAALRNFRAMLARVEGDAFAARYGLHSLRVSGYNLCRAACGTSLAVAQGGWHSTAHERYERFELARVLRMPQLMVLQAAAPPVPVTPAPVTPAAPPGLGSPGGGPPPARDPQHLGRRRGRGRGRGGKGGRHSPEGRGRGGAAEEGYSPVAPVMVFTPRPLDERGCVGRTVLCPRAMWPSWPCREHGGDGWEARIIERRSTGVEAARLVEAKVQFVGGRRPFQPMWLRLDALRPL